VDFGFKKNEAVDVLIRPEDVYIVGTDIGQLIGTVRSVLFKGVHYEMIIQAGGFDWKVHSTTMAPVGSRAGLSVVPFNIHVMHVEDETVITQEDRT
jgi:spermidine/putrescine transport system ATP-binding protein